MELLEVVTLNEEPGTREDATRLIRDAMDYFPEETWRGLSYRGNVEMEHGVEVWVRDEERGAFALRGLVSRLRSIRRLLEARGLLLGLTRDPVVVSYYDFNGSGFRRIVNLVKDYVDYDVGMVSLYGSDEEDAVRISAHGLGHNRGLLHHPEPIDLMYVGLTDGSSLGRDGFCDECMARLNMSLHGESRRPRPKWESLN